MRLLGVLASSAAVIGLATTAPADPSGFRHPIHPHRAEHVLPAACQRTAAALAAAGTGGAALLPMATNTERFVANGLKTFRTVAVHRGSRPHAQGIHS
jgi:hypothetical protein